MVKNNLSHSIRHVEPSATLVINELSSKLISEGKEVFRLGFGQSPFPVPKKIVQALQRNAHQKDYLPVKGLYTLREEVANFFRLKYGMHTTAKDVMIGPGSKELMYDFQVVFNIEELLLPTPSWVSYEPQAQLNNHKVIWIPTSEQQAWKIQPDAIIKLCEKDSTKKRTIILNYPSNPTGVTYSNDELEVLAMVFKRYRIIVISDEIYGELDHDGKHQTIAKYYPEGTIISTGLSKWAGAGGWRLGLFVFPQNLSYILEAMAIVASETFTSTSAPIQYAAIEAYRQDDSIDIYVKNSRKILKGVGIYVFKSLLKMRLTMPKPTGGFYVFPNFNKWTEALNKRGLFNSKDLCNAILNETGVALLPGEAFGHSNKYLTVRLSYVDFNGENLLNILEKNPKILVDDEFVEQYCPKITLAIKKIEKWLLTL